MESSVHVVASIFRQAACRASSAEITEMHSGIPEFSTVLEPLKLTEALMQVLDWARQAYKKGL